ncbi:hypothetical protein QUF55_10170, partial [Clostridiaceae bacterium HSG29]|nr:hypothetical protein [Clostridiaceae bacterium HSG29]
KQYELLMVKNDLDDVIDKSELEKLPKSLRKYMNYVGVIGKKRISHFKVIYDGEMKLDRNKPWASVAGEQYTFMDTGTRLFYMKMNYKKLPIYGLHHFNKEDASMVIKILDIFKVVDESGEYLKKAETVTYFNDMCLFAPSTLLNADIVWKELDDRRVEGTLTHDNVKVSAILYFDDEGKLINFTSEDRYKSEKGGELQKCIWSTPVKEYDNYNGLNLISSGEAIWHDSEEDFSYIKLRIKDIIVNP